MYVESIEIDQFRNYQKEKAEFSERTNILYGDNAQGKTNILEAIYVGATTKSHRTTKDKEMIRFGEDEAHLKLMVKKRNVGHRIDMHIHKNRGKQVTIDGISIRRSSELYGLINIIFFSPEDLSIVKEGPGERRRFVDMELSQLSRFYFNQLMDYNRVLNQRNNLLRSIAVNPSLRDTLETWNEQLVRYGREVIIERRKFVEMLREVVIRVHGEITGNKEQIDIRYEPSVNEDLFAKTLVEKQEQDIRFAMTTIGPQRDDMGIYINDRDVRSFGSQGQQRTAALTLKMAEIELVKKMIHDTPILLLDDVMSELDEKRREALLGSLDGIQTIITCTGYKEFIRERLSMDRIYHVDHGGLTVEMDTETDNKENE